VHRPPGRLRALSSGVRPAEAGAVKILVADDQVLWRSCLGDVLEEWGYEVVSASDGEEAWEQIRADPEIALLVTDWMMPRLSGPELCRRVCSLLLAHPLRVAGLRFARHHEACERLGGDLFHVFRLDRDRVALWVLDVSGHGTAAALHPVSLSHALCPFPERGGILMRDGAPLAPADVAAELNRRFPPLEQSGQYLTLLYGILDLPTLRFRYARARHPGPLRVRDGEATFHVEGGGIPIGIEPDAVYRDEELRLDAGDLLILFTDGVHEAIDGRSEEFGIDRLLAEAGHAARLGAAGAVEALRARLGAFRKQEPPRDDVTLLAVEVAPHPA